MKNNNHTKPSTPELISDRKEATSLNFVSDEVTAGKSKPSTTATTDKKNSVFNLLFGKRGTIVWYINIILLIAFITIGLPNIISEESLCVFCPILYFILIYLAIYIIRLIIEWRSHIKSTKKNL